MHWETIQRSINPDANCITRSIGINASTSSIDHDTLSIRPPILHARGFPHALHHSRSIGINADMSSIICPIPGVSTPILFRWGNPREAFIHFLAFLFFCFFSPCFAVFVMLMLLMLMLLMMLSFFCFLFIVCLAYDLRPRSLAALAFFYFCLYDVQ